MGKIDDFIVWLDQYKNWWIYKIVLWIYNCWRTTTWPPITNWDWDWIPTCPRHSMDFNWRDWHYGRVRVNWYYIQRQLYYRSCTIFFKSSQDGTFLILWKFQDRLSEQCLHFGVSSWLWTLSSRSATSLWGANFDKLVVLLLVLENLNHEFGEHSLSSISFTRLWDLGFLFDKEYRSSSPLLSWIVSGTDLGESPSSLTVKESHSSSCAKKE